MAVNPQDRMADAKLRLDTSTAALRRRLRATIARHRQHGPSRLAPGTLEPLRSWSHGRGRETVAVLVYRGVSSSEVMMVADALARPLEATVRLVSAEPGPVVSVEPARSIIAEPLDAVPRPYGLVIPGGLAWRREADRPEVAEWLRSAADEARGVIAVSTGTLLLAAVGLLEGREAAGHWLAGDLMAELGATQTTDRYVHRRLLATASGALAGAEAAARLATEMRYGP